MARNARLNKNKVNKNKAKADTPKKERVTRNNRWSKQNMGGANQRNTPVRAAVKTRPVGRTTIPALSKNTPETFEENVDPLEERWEREEEEEEEEEDEEEEEEDEEEDEEDDAILNPDEGSTDIEDTETTQTPTFTNPLKKENAFTLFWLSLMMGERDSVIKAGMAIVIVILIIAMLVS